MEAHVMLFVHWSYRFLSFQPSAHSCLGRKERMPALDASRSQQASLPETTGKMFHRQYRAGASGLPPANPNAPRIGGSVNERQRGRS
jgi:hypothetical protein